MKILQLRFRNFKGIRDFPLDLQGRNANIYGDNAVGKTSVFDGFTWLLFDKDSLGRASFGIKTLTPNGEAHHGMDHEVEGVLEVNGRQITLSKVYHEVWTKKRGSATKEFTGHTVDHYIDGVPVQAKEYAAKIAEIADEDAFRLLTSPVYFLGQMKWQDRRRLLLEVCGDLADAEVIASDASLARLTDILGNRSLEDHRKVIAARRAEINREIDRIPVRIDEVERALPDITGLDPDALRAEADAKRELIAQKRQQIARIESGGEIADKARSLNEIETRLLEIKNSYYAKNNTLARDKYREWEQRHKEALSYSSEINSAEQSLANIVKSISQKSEKMDQLRAEWSRVYAEQLTYESESVCPACGQALPEEQVEATRQKALERFNADKAARLEAIRAEGLQLKADVERLQNEEPSLNNDIEKLKAQKAAAEEACAKLLAEVEQLKADAQSYVNDLEYQQQLKGKELLQTAIAELKANAKPQIDALNTEIAALEAEVRAAEEKLAAIKRRKDGEKRIEELKEQERELAAEYERLEEELYLTEQFIRRKVTLLEEKINSHFKLTRFKLFEQQINGGLSECCVATYNGVPYDAGLNNAMRINLGLDCINVLSKHYGVAMPVFVDNAEAVTDLLPTVGQQIRLIVSKEDKELRVEIIDAPDITSQGGLFR
jgi:DNA repair exonuclease SbcCD ATPase subunit